MLPTARKARLTGALFGASALWCSAALAALPAAMDYAPVGAVAVVGVADLSAFDAHVSQLIGAVEAPMMMTPAQAINALGIGASINMKGSAAVIVQTIDGENEEHELLVLLPVTDYAKMLAERGEVQTNNGVSHFVLEGSDVYSKQVGAYALLGNKENAVRAFEGKPGQAAQFEARLGAAGKEVAGKSDVIVFVNPQSAGPLMRDGMDKMDEQMGMMGAMGGMGGNGDAGKAQAEQAKQAVDMLVRDGDSAVMGMSFGAKGASFSGSVSFKAGSESAAGFKPGGDSGAIMNRMPAQPFLMAFALDFRAPIISSWMEQMAAQGAAAMEGKMGIPGFDAMKASMDKADGQAMVVYPSPGGIMGGLFVNSLVYYASKDPQALIAAQRKAFEAMQVQQEGMSISTTIKPDATQINGVSADEYSMVFEMPGGGFGNPMAMLFGPSGGPSGYIAAAPHGVFQTMSKNSALMGAALQGGGFGKDAMLAQVSAELPAGRSAEFFLGVKPVLDQALVLAAMFMGNMQLDIPENLPPVGAAMAGRENGAVGTVFVPAPVIKVAVEIAGAVQQQMGGFGGPGMEEEDDGKPPF